MKLIFTLEPIVTKKVIFMNNHSFFLKTLIVIILLIEVATVKTMAQENAFIILGSSDAGNSKVSYRGNVFELMTIASDTVFIENTETGQLEMKISRKDSRPIKMNDIPIAGTDEVQTAALPERSLDEYFIEFAMKNKTQFDQLADGRYRIDVRNFVINEGGKIVYYKFDGLEMIPLNNNANNDKKNKEMLADINRLIHEFIISEQIHFEAAEKDKRKVLSVLLSGAYVGITVKDHKANVDL